MSIPVLIVAILNRPELLVRLVDSLDHPIDRVVVIDNGGVVDEAWTKFMGFTHIKPGHNLGVAASWNLGMKVTPHAPWWLITNHDIEFGPGDLAKLEAELQPRAAILYHLLGHAAFAVTPPLIQAVGTFDENFVNGYDEDLDFTRRCELAACPRVNVGFTGNHVGSATIMADPALRSWNGISHGANDYYYSQKWGGSKQGGETFDTPFNRGGHLGEWRMDFDRYRQTTWPRK